MRSVLTSVLELVGLSLIVTTVVLVYWPAAFAVAGAGLILISRAVSR